MCNKKNIWNWEKLNGGEEQQSRMWSRIFLFFCGIERMRDVMSCARVCVGYAIWYHRAASPSDWISDWPWLLLLGRLMSCDDSSSDNFSGQSANLLSSLMSKFSLYLSRRDHRRFGVVHFYWAIKRVAFFRRLCVFFVYPLGSFNCCSERLWGAWEFHIFLNVL